jgi:uncharacterized delta-60 repeat protein
MKAAVAVGVVLSAVVALVAPADAAPGGPDTTLGGAGVVTTDVPGTGEHLNDVVVQDDGRIVGVGQAQGRMLIARWLDDGTLDDSFDGDGRAYVDVGNPTESAEAVDLDSQGRIVVGGIVQGVSRAAVVRLTPDGELDPSFSGDGIATYGNGFLPHRLFDVVVRGDDRIVVVVRVPQPPPPGTTLVDPVGSRVLVARYRVNGTLDRTFHGTGVRILDPSDGSDVPTAVDLDAQGRIVVAGGMEEPRRHTGMTFVYRLRPGGGLDPTFSGDGFATHNLPRESDSTGGMIVDGSGRIVLAGGARGGVLVVRLTAAGLRDTSFSGDGRAFAALRAGTEPAQAVVEDLAGDLAVVGSTRGGGGQAYVARFTAAGALDPGFDGDGWRGVNVTPGSDRGNALVLDGDGDLVLAGVADGVLLLARLLSS